MIKTCQLVGLRYQHLRVYSTSGLGAIVERSRRRFELTHNPRHLKYESYSAEAIHPAKNNLATEHCHPAPGLKPVGHGVEAIVPSD